MTVQEEAQWCIQNDGMLAEIRKKIKSGKATYADTAAYSARAGKMIGALLSRRLPEIPLDEREQLCVELLHGQYIDINAAVDAAQSYMDKALGIRLTPQHPAFNGERAHQIGSSTADPTVPQETQQRRAGSATETAVKSMHDDRMKAEAKSRSRLGLDVTIERKGNDCCAWCAEVAGRYPMGEEPEGIFRRHDNCDCTVIYGSQVLRGAVNEKGKRTKTWEEVDPKTVRGIEPVRLTRAQAAAIEAEHLPKRLTPGAESGTMDSADSRDDKAARRRFDSLTPEQRAEVVMRGIQAPDATFSYDRPDNNAMTLLRRVPSLPFTFDVRAHGLDTLIEFFRQDFPDGDPRAFIDAYTLATILRGRSDFQAFLAACAEAGEKPTIRLLACSTGDTTNTGNCFAQLLANELGIVVYAPTDTLYPRLDGTFYVGDFQDGYMKEFIGRK